MKYPQVVRVLHGKRPDESYFWATHGGAELDLLLFIKSRRIGVEFKRMDAPGVTASMRIAMESLGLHRLMVIYPGVKAYSLGENVEVLPLHELCGTSMRI